MPRPLMPRPLMPLLLLAAACYSAGASAADGVEALSLAQVLDRFAAESPSLQQLEGRRLEAQAAVRGARAASMPILVGQGGYTRNNAEAAVDLKAAFEKLSANLPVALDTSSLPDGLIIQPLSVWNVGASLSVPLVAPVAWADASAARRSAQAADAEIAVARANLEQVLVRTAWQTGALEARVDASRHAEEAARAHVDRTGRKKEAGLATELELLAARTEASRRQSERLQAEADLDRARRALGALVGSRVPLQVLLPELPVADPVGGSTAGRPELRSVEALSRAAAAQRTSAWLRHLPSISGVGVASAQNVDLPTGQPSAWRLGIQATWVLYDGGARYALLDMGRARGVQADANAARTRLDLDREDADSAQALTVARSRLSLAEAGLATADAAEQAATRGHGAGLVTGEDLINAQQRRLDAALGLAASRAELGAALADRRRVLAQPQDRP